MAQIKIYSTPVCVYCKLAKEFFTKHNFPYVEFNVAEDDAARNDMLQKSGQMGVPVIDIDGNIIVGFDQRRITKILNIK